VATVGELGIIEKDSQVYKDLEVILKKVRKQIKDDAAAGVKDQLFHPLQGAPTPLKM
jgi:hypothetical protein